MTNPESPISPIIQSPEVRERTPAIIRAEIRSARNKLSKTYGDLNTFESDQVESPLSVKEIIDRGRKQLEDNAENMSDEGIAITTKVLNEKEDRLNGVINMDAATIWEGLSDEERAEREKQIKNTKEEQAQLLEQLPVLEEENKPYLTADTVNLAKKVVESLDQEKLALEPEMGLSEQIDRIRKLALEGEEGLKKWDYSILGNAFAGLLENSFRLNDSGYILPEDTSTNREELQLNAYKTHVAYHQEYYGSYYDGLAGDWTVESILPRSLPKKEISDDINSGQQSEVREDQKSRSSALARLLTRFKKLRKR